jgi:hypothetical protein
MAQRIRRLTTDQEIPGSNPGGIEKALIFFFIICQLNGTKSQEFCKFCPPEVALKFTFASDFQHFFL